MDPGEYLDARWYALVRTAVDLGVPEEEAPALVQRVLAENTRRIRRAEDPDPLVHEALREAVLGVPPSGRPRRRWPAVAAMAGALVAVGAVVALTRPHDPPTDHLTEDQVPSLFGYDGDSARALLERRGFHVTVAPLRACETMDRVVRSDPPVGASYDEGADIRVYVSVPAAVECLTNYSDRETAWQLLDLANGHGAGPPFADRVYVSDGGPTVVLTAAQARDRDSWHPTKVLDLLREASQRVALVDERASIYALPAIRVTQATEGLGTCGVPNTSVAGTADAFALVVRPPDRRGCGVRVDVYRDAGRVEVVQLYRSPASPSTSP